MPISLAPQINTSATRPSPRQKENTASSDRERLSVSSRSRRHRLWNLHTWKEGQGHAHWQAERTLWLAALGTYLSCSGSYVRATCTCTLRRPGTFVHTLGFTQLAPPDPDPTQLPPTNRYLISTYLLFCPLLLCTRPTTVPTTTPTPTPTPTPPIVVTFLAFDSAQRPSPIVPGPSAWLPFQSSPQRTRAATRPTYPSIMAYHRPNDPDALPRCVHTHHHQAALPLPLRDPPRRSVHKACADR